jgi:hypothetical protein
MHKLFSAQEQTVSARLKICGDVPPLLNSIIDWRWIRNVLNFTLLSQMKRILNYTYIWRQMHQKNSWISNDEHTITNTPQWVSKCTQEVWEKKLELLNANVLMFWTILYWNNDFHFCSVVYLQQLAKKMHQTTIWTIFVVPHCHFFASGWF